MAKKSNTALAYETLLGIILPAGILEAFEVSEVTEEHTGIKRKQVWNVASSISILMSVTFVQRNGMTSVPTALPKRIASMTSPSVTVR